MNIGVFHYSMPSFARQQRWLKGHHMYLQNATPQQKVPQSSAALLLI